MSGHSHCVDDLAGNRWVHTVVFSNQGLIQYKDCPTQESACKKKPKQNSSLMLRSFFFFKVLEKVMRKEKKRKKEIPSEAPFEVLL